MGGVDGRIEDDKVVEKSCDGFGSSLCVKLEVDLYENEVRFGEEFDY